MGIELWKPRYHGNGFIQVYLTDAIRLHIWEPALSEFNRVVNAQIHDHRFWFESTILQGRLHHVTYEVSRETGITPTHAAYEVVPTSQNKEGAIPASDCSCSVLLLSHETFGPGETYNFGGPGNFHETYAFVRTVTLMTKLDQNEEYRARIVAPLNQKPDHAFEGIKPSEARLRTITQEALSQLLLNGVA